jgi:hypothetical protein
VLAKNIKKNLARCTMGFGVSNGSKLAMLGVAVLVCSPGDEADENWNMKMYNKKQYLYFICSNVQNG